MKKTLFANAFMGLALSIIATSAFAADELRTSSNAPNTASRALKFRITETGGIEDAKGSNLMQRFRESLVEEVAIWKLKQDKCLGILKGHIAQLQQGTGLLEAERFVIETDAAALKRKIKIFEENILQVHRKRSFTKTSFEGNPYN